MSGFRNPILGGGGALQYPSIHSPGFVAGSAGWSINKDGSAEFNNVVIRNGQIVSGTQLSYSTSPGALGTLIGSVSTIAGTDSYGNAYVQGMASYTPAGGGYFVTALNNGTLLLLSNPTYGGAYVTQGQIYVGSTAMEFATAAAAGFHFAENVAITGTLLLSAGGPVLQNGSGRLQVLDGLDGNTYDTERLTLDHSSGTQTISSTTPATIGQLTCALGTGKYRLYGRVLYAGGQAAGTPTFRFTASGGLATSSMQVAIDYGATLDHLTALGTASAGPTLLNGGLQSAVFDGIIVISTAGTISLQGAEGTNGDTWTVQNHAFLDVMPV